MFDLRTILSALLLPIIGLNCISGCAVTPQAFPREFGQIAQATATSLADQAVWQSIAGSVNGEVIEPGIEGYAGVLYVTGGKLTGVSGTVALSGQGTGSGQLSDLSRDEILGLIQSNPELFRQYIESVRGPDAPTEGS